MAISILKDGQALDLNPDFTIEMKLTSPVYSKDGSQSISSTFPVTPHNNQLLDFPLKWEKTDKAKDTFSIIMEDGSFRQSSELSIQGGSDSEGISFNVGFDEAILYAKIKDKKLSELDLPLMEFEGATRSEKVKRIINMLEYYRTQGSEESDLAVFPVVLKDDEINEVRYQYVINPLALQGPYPTQQPIIWQARSEKQVINGEVTDISVPDGYGVAPFPKIWKIIELIFNQLKLQVVENIFKTHRQLSMLCSIHNCVDAICQGKIDYKHLMPDVTVIGFLDALFAKFGAVFFINSNRDTVKVKLLDDILASDEYLNLTMRKASSYAWNKTEAKQIKLKLNTGLKDAVPGNENYSDFLKSYNNVVSGIVNVDDPSERFTVAFERPTGRYYRKNLIDNQVKTEYIGSDFFNWEALENIFPAEEISASDESVPMIRSQSYGIVPYLINELKHVSTNLVSDSIAEKDKEAGTKLAFVFYYDKAVASPTPGRIEPYYFTSSFNYDRNGNTIKDSNGDEYTLSLTARSLFTHFWKRWDAVLRHANQQYELKVNLSNVEIMNMETHQKILIDNQPFLIEQLDYSVGKESGSCKMTIRSLALKKPYNMNDEQQIPATESPLYYWTFENHFDEKLAEVKTEHEALGLIFRGSEVITAPTEENAQAFLPPTESDYLSGHTEILYFSARAKFEVRTGMNPDYTFINFDYPVIYSVSPIV
ncbi:MAG: hypothetical protein LBG15_07970 [Dysgonamonadaceae bacterium]|jgi:hypothetical protein|nr:hypothetical protein [Dysgonamonadaceae bacterium]